MRWLVKIIKRTVQIFAAMVTLVMLVFVSLFVYVKYFMTISLPVVADKSSLQLQRQQTGENIYRIGHNWLRKTKSGLWEEYVEGAPFERGVITGKLNKELLNSQEVAFIDYIRSMIPSDNYLRFLDLFARFFNRNLTNNIPEENKLEIYGESFSVPEEFNYVAPPYERMLNYHAAHDIGHMMQNFQLVGCTSFGVWADRTEDSSLFVGRNCDFYSGDKFTQDKIVYFCNPTEGNKFVMIAWGGMMGCLSGMNLKGLTVTINAAKSDMPTGSAMPISLLAREILQYAGNINEAYAIAKKRKTFVAESIMIGSAADHKTGIIEKSINRISLYDPASNQILCTNHFQSDTFKNDPNNIQNIDYSASNYRYQRLTELLDSTPKFNAAQVARVLRDRKGLHGKNIGTGNEKAVNQFICHHSVIFQPEKRLFWVSTQPYQLGEYVCYDLKKVFSEAVHFKPEVALNDMDKTIPADTFLCTRGWIDYLKYKSDKELIRKAIKENRKLLNEEMFTNEIVAANPEYWEAYYWAGKYYESRGAKKVAAQYFESASTKEVNDKLQEEEIRKYLNK